MNLEPNWGQLRERMVVEQLEGRDIVDLQVLEAMRVVPRHRFVPAAMADRAYEDRPLPLGHDATISQPYIVAHMLEAARVRAGHRVLDVGSGCGYAAAVAAQIGATVFGVEIIDDLVLRSRRTLAELGFGNVNVRAGDGRRGWPEHAPYDAIVVGAAPRKVPDALREQLAEGGVLVLPVGERYRQDIRRITRTGSTWTSKVGIPVRFVPLVGNDGL